MLAYLIMSIWWSIFAIHIVSWKMFSPIYAILSSFAYIIHIARQQQQKWSIFRNASRPPQDMRFLNNSRLIFSDDAYYSNIKWWCHLRPYNIGRWPKFHWLPIDHMALSKLERLGSYSYVCGWTVYTVHNSWNEWSTIRPFTFDLCPPYLAGWGHKRELSWRCVAGRVAFV